MGGDVAGVADERLGQVGRPLDVSGQLAVDVEGATARPPVVGAAGELDHVQQVEDERVGAHDVELAGVEQRPIVVEDGAQGRPQPRHQVRYHFVVDDAEAGVLGVADVQRAPHFRPLHESYVRRRRRAAGAAAGAGRVPRPSVVQRVIQTLEFGRADERAEYTAPALRT